MWRLDSDGKARRLGDDEKSIVWVPTTDITFHQAQFPTASRKVWRQTVAFALEEFIIGHVEEYHFALNDAALEDNKVPTAVVPRETMDQWTDALAEDEVKAGAMWPDLLAVPRADGECVLWHEGEQCWLRTGECDGASGNVEWICSVAQLLELDGELKVFSDAPEALPEALRDKAEPLPAPLEELMLQVGAAPPLTLNLLQGEYAPESAAKVWLGAWKRTALVASLFLGFYLGHIVVESERLTAHTAILKKETGVLLARAGLQGQAIDRNMRAQVQRYVEKVRSAEQRQSSGVWSLMLGIEPLLSACKPCVVESIDYDNEQIAMIVSSAPDLNRFEEGLQGLPTLRYERVDLPGDDERQRARFRIREGGREGRK